MRIGEVLLKLGIIDKDFKNGLNKAENQVRKTVNNMKNIIVGAKLGQLFFSGASQQAQEELKQVQTALSAMSEGFSVDMVKNLQPIIEQIDFLGVSADQAADTLYKFILTGRGMGLQQMGIYLDQDTQSMLAAASAAERYEWAIKNIPKEINKVQNALSPATKQFFEFQKRADDVKKALGTTFLNVINSIINSFGGLVNTMKIAIIGFTAYKTATILGNVGIGISKTIAMTGVAGAPAAIAMGAAALAAIGALIGGAAIAVDALNSIPPPSATNNPEMTQTLKPEEPKVIVNITRDKYGDVAKVSSESSGGGSASVQTNYGG